MTHDLQPALPAADQTSKTTLEETVALLESILEATHDGILVLNLDRRIVRYNPKFLEMFRVTAEQVEKNERGVVGAVVSEQLEDPTVLVTISRESWSDPSAEVVDVLRFTDGRVYHRFVAPHRVNGQMIGRVASYRDITQQVSAERALEQHRTFLEKAQEVAHVGSWVAELDGSNRLAWSRETYRIFGLDLNSFSGTSTEFLSFVHQNDVDLIRRASEAAQAGQKPYDVEHRIVLRNGTTRWIHEKADVVCDDRGRPIRMIGTIQDITERRLLEEQLRQSQKLEAIGRLAGGIAHDFNNALTAIAGYTELALLSLSEEHPARPDVHEIRRATERAKSVTRQLLAFSRRQVLEPRVFSLGDVTTGLSQLLERLMRDSIQVKTMVAEKLPPIYGDPGQLEQAVINLAMNARDAMPNGGVLTLAVSTVDVDAAFTSAHRPLTTGRYAELSVSDTGEGMDADTQAHIFEPFFTTKDVGKGTGLGLAMVYGTVSQSGGHIFVESEIGRGTTFRLYFPDASSKSAQDPAPGRGPAAAPVSTILVVEDEPAIRNLVVTTLGHEGYRVLYASSGEEALAIADTDHGHIDLLLTDRTMPDMAGIELAVALLRKQPHLPVVVMSSDDRDEVPNIDERPVQILAKPFTPRQLRRKVREALGGGTSAARPEDRADR